MINENLRPFFLLGSIPMGDAEDVFDAVANTFAPRLTSVPADETGVRSN